MIIQSSKFKVQNFSSKFKVIKQFINFAFLIITLHFALLTLHLSQANAAGVSLGVFPPIIQIQADPPANIESSITIQNLGEETVDLDIVFKPFTAKDSENGEVKFLLENQGMPGANPLIFQKIQIFDGDHAVKNITLAPGQQKKLNFHIGIAKDEPISDYYFSIIFTSHPGGSAATDRISDSIEASSLSRMTNESTAIGGVATNVLLSIGKGQAKGVIEEFSSPLFLEKGPVPFTVRVKNTGKHVIAPIGQILIKNFFGQTVGKVDLLPVNILAGSIRSVPSSEIQPLNTKYQILNTNSPRAFWRENFLLGPYTANLTIALSDEGPVYKKTINFYSAPTQILIGLIIAILLVSLITSKVRKRLLTSS